MFFAIGKASLLQEKLLSCFPFVVKGKKLHHNNLYCDGAVGFSFPWLFFPHDSAGDAPVPRVAVVRALSPHIGSRGWCTTGKFGLGWSL